MRPLIVIKGMKMPDSCYHCKLQTVCDKAIANNFKQNGRDSKCPLVEVRSVDVLGDFFSMGDVKRMIEMGSKIYFRGEVVKSVSFEECGEQKTYYTLDGIREIKRVKNIINSEGYPKSVVELYEAFEIAKKYIGEDATMSQILKWAKEETNEEQLGT